MVAGTVDLYNHAEGSCHEEGESCFIVCSSTCGWFRSTVIRGLHGVSKKYGDVIQDGCVA